MINTFIFIVDIKIYWNQLFEIKIYFFKEGLDLFIFHIT